MPAIDSSEATALIDFWFGAPASAERFQPREIWFKRDDVFDREVGRRFLPLQQHAAAGDCAAWARAAEPCLALILALDQLPRNLFRDSALAFATDAMARETADNAIKRGFDRSLPAVCRVFVYLPFQHSESLADQERSLALYEALASDPSVANTLDFARRHHAIIARFGRFPHRNRALGRSSTPEEEAFLKEPGSSF